MTDLENELTRLAHQYLDRALRAEAVVEGLRRDVVQLRQENAELRQLVVQYEKGESSTTAS